MRYLFVLLISSLFLFSSEGVLAEEDLAKRADYLIKKSDCLTCHRVDKKLLGPSYVDVANKYKGDENAVDTLIPKVLEGGSGNWGVLPMTPHPRLSEEHAREIIEWILTLATEEEESAETEAS